MGNHNSNGRRDQRRQRQNNNVCGGVAVQALRRVEELRGPPVDAYDKLIAWLAEMAESENVQLDTNIFVKQLTRVCSAPNAATVTTTTTTNSSNNGHSSSSAVGAGDRCSLSDNGGGGGGVGIRRSMASRQHSASCDSRASSSDTYKHRSFEDSLDTTRLTWRQPQESRQESRQATLSDDLEEDPDVRNASMESLYSSSDRDSELEAMPATYTAAECTTTSSRRARFMQQRDQQRDMRRPLLRQALLGSSIGSNSCGGGGGRRDHRGSVLGGSEVLAGHYPTYGSCGVGSGGNSSMLGMASGLMQMQMLMMPCSASTGDLDKINTSMDDPGEELPARLLARRKSVSLLNLTPPGRPAYLEHDLPPDTPPGEPGEPFLDDTLLDGNMADILFSVEALWPKK